MTREQLQAVMAIVDAHGAITKPTAIVCDCGKRWARPSVNTDEAWRAAYEPWREHRLDELMAALAPEPAQAGMDL